MWRHLVKGESLSLGSLRDQPVDVYPMPSADRVGDLARQRLELAQHLGFA